MAFLQVDYKSKQLGRKTRFNVFLPADTDPAGRKGAPWKTLYLLHGIYGDCTSWVTSSCVQRYAEDRNLCVVMPDGENGFYLDHPDYMNRFAGWIGEELVEAARGMFPLSEKREDTWIGGLSMGGYGALRTGLKYADTFGGIAAFSSALILSASGPYLSSSSFRDMPSKFLPLSSSAKSPSKRVAMTCTSMLSLAFSFARSLPSASCRRCECQ